MNTLSNTVRIAVILAAYISPFSGCRKVDENEPTFPVTGTVTYQGKPVEGATVVLVAQSEGGRGAVGNTDAEGHFELGTFAEGDGAVAGSYKVKVFKYEMVSEPPNDGDDVMTEEEEEEMYTGVEEVEEAGNLLPAKYENPDRSGFTLDVVDQPSVLNLDLN